MRNRPPKWTVDSGHRGADVRYWMMITGVHGRFIAGKCPPCPAPASTETPWTVTIASTPLGVASTSLRDDVTVPARGAIWLGGGAGSGGGIRGCGRRAVRRGGRAREAADPDDHVRRRGGARLDGAARGHVRHDRRLRRQRGRQRPRARGAGPGDDRGVERPDLHDRRGGRGRRPGRPDARGEGGFGGGGAGGAGGSGFEPFLPAGPAAGGGGGASDVRTGPADDSGLASRLLVAAGGGGAGSAARRRRWAQRRPGGRRVGRVRPRRVRARRGARRWRRRGVGRRRSPGGRWASGHVRRHRGQAGGELRRRWRGRRRRRPGRRGRRHARRPSGQAGIIRWTGRSSGGGGGSSLVPATTDCPTIVEDGVRAGDGLVVITFHNGNAAHCFTCG